MASRDKERLAVIEDLVSPLAECAPLLQHLDEAGAKPCAVLLQTALEYRRVGEWEDCRKVALSAREYAWEQLHRRATGRGYFRRLLNIANRTCMNTLLKRGGIYVCIYLTTTTTTTIVLTVCL